MDMLHNFGIPSHVDGYYYMSEAIKIVIKQEKIKITKDVYPILAINFNKKECCIERSIRHAIEIGWLRANIKSINDTFGYSLNIDKDKPTNSEFIFTIANKIKLEIGEL